jgi:hypothetical protein
MGTSALREGASRMPDPGTEKVGALTGDAPMAGMVAELQQSSSLEHHVSMPHLAPAELFDADIITATAFIHRRVAPFEMRLGSHIFAPIAHNTQ